LKRKTHYLNTDLELFGEQSLAPLAERLASGGIFSLHDDERAANGWCVTLETEEQFTEPESNIAAILSVVENFDVHSRQLWAACMSRELNIGYDCGDEPWAFNHAISATTVRRMAALGISLRITLYPADAETSTAPQHTHKI
jgi:hypothetical protein